jgi:hypothetical protein
MTRTGLMEVTDTKLFMLDERSTSSPSMHRPWRTPSLSFTCGQVECDA